MSTCPICQFVADGCLCAPEGANDNENSLLRLPPDDALRKPSAVQRLSIVYGNLALSRRKIVDHVADTLFATDRVIVDGNGRRIWITDSIVDDAFDTEGDPSVRWVSDWLHFRDRAPRQALQYRMLPRVRLLWAALALKHPSLAQAVVR
jgi:hypothetical protein